MLGLDSAQFTAGAKRAQAATAGLKASMAGFAKSTAGMLSGFAGIAGVTAAINGTKAALQAFGAIADAAASTGLDAEFLQGIAYQARLAGVEFGTLTGALDAFNKNSGLAAVNKGKMASALAALNPQLLESIKNATTQEQRVRLAADAIRDAASASERAALATTLFGEAGANLAGVFAGGAAQIDSMAAKARDMGIIVERDLIARADQLGDEFDTASMIVDLKLKQAFINLAPQIVGAANLAAEFARLMGVAADQLRGIEDRQFLRPLQNQLAETYNAMEPVKQQIAEIEAALAGGAPNGMILKLDLSEAQTKLAGFEEQAMRLLTRITELQGAPSAGAPAPAPAAAPAFNPNLFGAADLAMLDLPTIKMEGLTSELANVSVGATAAGQALASIGGSAAAGIEPVDDALSGLADTLASGFADVFSSVIDGSKSAGEAVGDLAKSLANMALQQGFQMLFGSLFGGLGGGGGGLHLGYNLAAGGQVHGPGTSTSDSIPAMLSNGEFVVNAKSAKQFAPLLQAINAGGVKLAAGGFPGIGEYGQELIIGGEE